MESAQPLAGVRVLDLSTFLAGPFCTQILADLGADVIKVEPPQGDPTRHLPPHEFEGEGAYYLSINHSKRSICIDLSQQEGRAVLTRLVADTHVVVHNYRPDVAQKLGADFERLSAVNPSMIYCAISGFGQDGPYSLRPAYDMVVQALSGGMSLTGDKDGRPVRAGIPIGDLCAGEQAAIAICASLAHRNAPQSGEDQPKPVFIDIAMLDVQISLLTYLAQYYLISGVVPGPQGRGHESIPTYCALRTADERDIVICANTEAMWQRMCNALGLEELLDDRRFADNATRNVHREALMTILADRFRREPSDRLVSLFDEYSVPCAVVNNVQEALEDPQVQHREMVMSVQHASGRPLSVLTGAIRFGGAARKPPTAPPTLGQHTAEVLHSVGYSPTEVDALTEGGTVRVSSLRVNQGND